MNKIKKYFLLVITSSVIGMLVSVAIYFKILVRTSDTDLKNFSVGLDYAIALKITFVFWFFITVSLIYLLHKILFKK